MLKTTDLYTSYVYKNPIKITWGKHKMEERTTKRTRLLSKRGDSLGINLPKDQIDFLGASEGTILALGTFEGKKVKFIAIWKEEGK